MDTYSVAPPVDGYNYVNTDPGSPYYMWDYKLGASKPDGSIEHVYGDGRTNWVKVGFVDVPAGQWTPPPGASPNTLETSSVPGAPIINPPAAPAPPPAPAPGPPPSNPAPPPNGGPEIEAIQKEEQTIESEIGRMAGAQLPKEAYQQDSQIQQGIRELQNQIYGAYESGALSQQQMQDMQGTTVRLGVDGIQQEMQTLKRLGSVSETDQVELKAQFSALSTEVRVMEEKGALSESSGLSQSMQALEKEINSLQLSSGSTPTPTPPPTTLGGQTGSSGGNNNDNSPGAPSSGGGTVASSGDGSTNAPVSSVASPASTSSPDPSSSPAPAPVSGATYSVVSGDTMWGIAQSNGIPLSQLEALNPQIQNPDLILPGESINLGSGGVGTSASSTAGAPATGATYTVVHGDTLSGIAQANGMSTSQIEALNPQIKDPDLIFPGQSVNLGSGGTTSPAPDTSQTSPVVAAPASSTDTSGSANSGITGSSSSSGGGAIGFPNKSSYSSIGGEAAKAGDITLGEKAAAQGWADSSGGATSDIAKNVFEVDTHTSTDPLKINDEKK